MLSVVASDATDRAARSSITSDAAVVEPAPWMPAMDTEFVIAVHESEAAAEHHLAERQRLRALYSGGGRGSNENSGDTLRALHAITYKCSECEGLIDHLAASRVAPTSLGCTGRGCSKNHRTPAYAVSQTRMAVALILGERGLVDRPERGQRVTVLYGRTRTLRVARAALDNALRHLCMSHTVHL